MVLFLLAINLAASKASLELDVLSTPFPVVLIPEREIISEAFPLKTVGLCLRSSKAFLLRNLLAPAPTGSSTQGTSFDLACFATLIAQLCQ